MTADDFQEALCEEMRSVFSDDRFLNSAHKWVPLNVHGQDLPIRDNLSDRDYVPYLIVRLENGEVKDGISPQEVTVTFWIACFDDSMENQGHKWVLHVIHKIQERFAKNPIMGRFYRATDKFEWELQEERSFPYFIGAAAMVFETPAIRKESPYI